MGFTHSRLGFLISTRYRRPLGVIELAGLLFAMTLSATPTMAETTVETQAFGSAQTIPGGLIPGSSQFDPGTGFASVPEMPFDDESPFSYEVTSTADIFGRRNEVTATATGDPFPPANIQTFAGGNSLFEDEILFDGEGVGSVMAEIHILGDLGTESNTNVFYDFTFDTGDELNISGNNNVFFQSPDGATGAIDETLTLEFDYSFRFNDPTSVMFESYLSVDTETINIESNTARATALITRLEITNGPVLPPNPDGFTWINPSGGAFHVASNWEENSVPEESADTATFNLNDTYTVLFSDDARTGATQVLDGDVSFLLNGHTYTAQDGADSGLIVDANLTVGGGPVNAQSVKIGRFAGGNGRLTVTGGFAGVNTTLNAPLGIQVGIDSPGELIVEDGTRVDAPSVAIGGQSSGAATVDGISLGTPSRLEADDLFVGTGAAQGSLTASDRGIVDTLNLTVGGNGNVTVTGRTDENASTLTVLGRTLVGGANGTTAVLNVTDGATASLGDTAVFVGANGPGTLNINGVRDDEPSTVNVQADSAVGVLGTGNVNVQNGGKLKALGDFFIGLGDEGHMTVDGVNNAARSTFEVKDLAVGDESSAANTLTVSNGGHVSAEKNLLIRGGGTATVQGFANSTPSLLEVKENNLQIGFGDQMSELKVMNGAHVLVDGPLGSGSLQVGVQGPGKLTVNSVGGVERSSVTVSQGQMVVGILDSGSVHVQGGAELRAVQINVGFGDQADMTVDGAPGGLPSNVFALDIIVGSEFSAASPTSLTVSNGAELQALSSITVGHGMNSPAVLDYRTGSVLIGQGLPSAAGSLLISSGGVLSGTGTLIGGDPGTVGSGVNNFAGTVSSGSSPGILTIDSNYMQGAEGILEIEIAGEVAGSEYDQLRITGDADIDGILDLFFQDGFAPTAGQEFLFTVVDGETTGEFRDVNIFGLAEGFESEVHYDGGQFRLVALTDGVVVPEPASVCMALMSLACLLWYERRERRGRSRS